jgi:hypothetical protein
MMHYRLGLEEFEDIIVNTDAVDLVAPRTKPWFAYGTRIANRLACTFRYGINPGVPKLEITREYDLFVAIVQFPKDLLHLEALTGWKRRCRQSVCWVNEFWVSELQDYKYFVQLLDEFDYVVIHSAGSLGPVQDRVHGECFHLPYGVDAMLFCPYPALSRRVIDVYSIGRRSEATHRALLKLAEERGLFYIYDTIDGDRVSNGREHRELVANIAKRSKYFLVNPGKFDIPCETKGQREFGNRFFEGAASGTIMIGESPKTEQFGKAFDWHDAVIEVACDSTDIGLAITELDGQPERQAAIRKANVVHALRRHDWVYRWEAILATIGLDSMPELRNRKWRLERLAEMVERLEPPASLN